MILSQQISTGQETAHMVAETIAVVAVAPFMLWLAAQPTLPTWARWVSGIIGVGTLAVDGTLLYRYATGRTA
jgi:hypothetical protein